MQASKYKIGLWRKYNSGELIEVINYDEYLVNGEEIIFDTPEKRLLNLIKQKADSLVVNTFGSEFSEKYIVFNLDKSKFSTNSKLMNPSQPYGVQLLGKASSNSNIEYADMCYDIVINDTLRFDAIMIRIDKNLNVIGRKIIEQYPNREFFFCRGLDNTLRNKISKKALNFKRIAKKNNFSLDAKRTYISLEWERKEGIFGKLFLLIEEEVRVEDIEDGWTTYYKRIRINLNNGKQEFIEKESSETIRID